MSAEPVLVPVPICEVCWLIEHTTWEPESIDQHGKLLMRLVGVDVPEKVNTDSVEICGVCNSITVSGIYIMRDPNMVEFLDDDEYSDYEEDHSPTSFTINLSEDRDFEDEN